MIDGLSQDVLERINQVLVRHSAVEKAILYGSRAKGNFRPGSDIDLTLVGEGLSLKILNKISVELDDMLLPYTFDLSIQSQISNPELLEHIDRVGKVIYQTV